MGKIFSADALCFPRMKWRIVSFKPHADPTQMSSDYKIGSLRRFFGCDCVVCQSALNVDPLSARNIDPPLVPDGGCPGSPWEGTARLRVTLCVTRSEGAREGPVGPLGQPGCRGVFGIRRGF